MRLAVRLFLSLKTLLTHCFGSLDPCFPHGTLVVLLGVRVERTAFAVDVVAFEFLTEVFVPNALGNRLSAYVAAILTAFSASHLVAAVRLDEFCLALGCRARSDLGLRDCLFHLEATLGLHFVTLNLIAPHRNMTRFATFSTAFKETL
jgi:hypothetical protein